MTLVTSFAQQKIYADTYQSKDCKTQEGLDTTGAYNVSTNPTGYGAPNYATADIDVVVLKVMQPNTNEYVEYVFDGSTTPTASQIVTAAENFPINTFILGETTADDLGQLPDGSSSVIYIPVFTQGLMLTFTQGSRAFTGALLTTDPHAGMNYVRYNGTTYGATITSATTGVLDSEFVDPDGTYEVGEGFGSEQKFQAFCQGDSCLARINGEIATQNCGCDNEQRKEFMNMDATFEGAKALFACESYTNCQKAVDIVTNYCNDTGCGCS